MTAAAPTTRDWPAIVERIHDRYPSTAARDYRSEVRGRMDTDTLASILRDVVRVGHSPVQRGQRPMPSAEVGLERLRTIRGEDFSVAPFAVAFAALAKWRSRATIARQTGLERTRVQRLLSGWRIEADGTRTPRRPTIEEMEIIAAAYDKQPTYFAEYRTHVVAALVAAEMASNPELSATVLHRLGSRE